MLTLFYKFVTFSINLLLFDHGICYFLKYSAGNAASSHFRRDRNINQAGCTDITQNRISESSN